MKVFNRSLMVSVGLTPPNKGEVRPGYRDYYLGAPKIRADGSKVIDHPTEARFKPNMTADATKWTERAYRRSSST